MFNLSSPVPGPVEEAKDFNESDEKMAKPAFER